MAHPGLNAQEDGHSSDNSDIPPPDGGYDLEIFVDRDRIIEYICQICHNVSRDCVEVSCGNGHIFCFECIKYHFEINGHSCPADRTQDINITQNDFVKRKILASNVKCKYNKFNCEWIGVLKNFDQHCINCNYKPIACKYCKMDISLTAINEHYLQCNEYLVKCSWCNNMYRRKILNNHITNCYCKPINCPNNGCSKQIESNKLQEHLENECLERIIICPSFQKFGCQQKIKYKDAEKHNNEQQLHHLQLQMQWVLMENNNKSQQISQLKSHVLQV